MYPFGNRYRTVSALFFVAAVLSAPALLFASKVSSPRGAQTSVQNGVALTQVSPETLPRIAPDNSRRNVLPERTADDQPNDRTDRLTAAHIRRAIYADKALSIYAHNVKIIVVRGQVTLEGPVHSQDEPLEVASDAATVVRSQTISNRLTVA